MENRMVMRPMLSRDLEGQNRDPNCLRLIISKRLEIDTWFQRITNRKLVMENRMNMWSMTSRDLERSNSIRVQYLENGWR